MSDQVKTIADAMNEAATELDNRPDNTPEERSAKPETPEKRTKSVADIKPIQDEIRGETDKPKWEAPGWTKRWQEQSRKALEAIASMDGAGDHLKALTGELDQTYSYVGKRDQVLANVEKRYGPINDMLGQAEQNFTMRGQSLQQGLGQMFAVSQALEQNPDQTLPWLGQLYKPRDPAAVIQALSQAWGADLGQLAQGQPWVDPTIQNIVNPLVQQVQQLQTAQYQQQQWAQQQQMNSVLSHISAFENATDESGKPLHPYFKDMYDEIVIRVQRDPNKDLKAAYDLAARYHPAAQEEARKSAEQQALQNAARNTAVTNQASVASRNVNSSARGSRESGNLSLKDSMKLADKQLGLS